MAKEQKLTVLFADVCGSTRLYETIGDTKARQTIAHCISRMTAVTHNNGGTLIKTIGDEVMVTFDSVDAAATAAMQMQTQISGALVIEGQPIAIRAGFHFGPVLLESGDVFGDTVNLAARLAAQSKAGQVLTSSDAVHRLGSQWADSIRRIDRAAVKGKREEVELWELLWQRDDLTSMAPPDPEVRQRGARTRLVLEYQGQTIDVSAKRTAVTMGRADQNDLVVNQTLVSRLHARIEHHQGRFVLSDQSTNGTYLIESDGEESFVRRDILSLHGGGFIGLGKAPESDSPEAIRYIITDQEGRD
ncbi:adenylate/guanylate cyclase domain-containing protein [Marinobacterium rhizophilum]|uniref:adenylate/guanylate cyclase domain-containing protein n=1 Tax=Marinobacterium rhizophilum TaxID=420402 RepID=UPI00035CDF6C|nr:adenylate/guanylate cyclase domain-containing protein [Marinobacterium rhizophilum]